MDSKKFWLAVLAGIGGFLLTVGGFGLWGWLVWLGKAESTSLIVALTALLTGGGVHLVKRSTDSDAGATVSPTSTQPEQSK